jgi:hypothetical protein
MRKNSKLAQLVHHQEVMRQPNHFQSAICSGAFVLMKNSKMCPNRESLQLPTERNNPTLARAVFHS